MMTTKNKVNEISSFLDEVFPNVGCELVYNKDYELVIAVMLSAQTTDISVNKVTPILFDKNKAKNVIAIAKALVNDYGGVVPSDKDELQKLPGVGNKTAGVIRAEIFRIPDLPVDTHILRISKRLNLVDQKSSPLDTEIKLKKLFPKETWIKLHHQLIHFGRYKCMARNPLCEGCKLANICNKK